MASENTLQLVVKASEVERDPTSYQMKATEEQCAALVERFGLVSLSQLEADLTTQTRVNDLGVLIKGHVKAKLVQRCVVSLNDVPETIDEDFELLLVDAETANRMDEDESYLDADAPEYDALEGDEIDLGEVVAQTLSIVMEPYPRAEGVEVSSLSNPNVSLNAPELEKPNPFAALSKLKDKS